MCVEGSECVYGERGECVWRGVSVYMGRGVSG